MRLLVNTLSIGSMSGNHVVYGFLRPFSKWMLPTHKLVVLHYEGNPPPADVVAQGIETIVVPESYRHWLRRTAWETFALPETIRRQNVDAVLTVSGATLAKCPVPQITLCQNPWCYRPTAHYRLHDHWKAWLQRLGYRRAFRNAKMMIYISNHLRDLYRSDNPNHEENCWAIAHVGLNHDTLETAKQFRDTERDPYSIVSVSAMARWKGAETLVESVQRLHQRGLPATLKLVGPWPQPDYEQDIAGLIRDRSLQDSVSIVGRVSDDELHKLYARSQVFALMSSCESFGIPAAEAMAFGTPIVSTDCCAIAEICQGAGAFGPLGDVDWTTDTLEKALTDSTQWQQWSSVGRERASQLSWEQCAQPLKRIPELIEDAPPANQPAPACTTT